MLLSPSPAARRGADVQRGEVPSRADEGSRLDGHGAGSGAQIEDLLTRPQRPASDDAADDLCKAIIDFTEINWRHAIPNAELPPQPFLLILDIRQSDPPQ